MRSRPAANALAGAALFLAAAALVVAVTWPWAAHWRGAFLDHWDPPFHAWKLEFMARRILAGDVLLRSGNANMLYPHSGTLYYEALQYPPALFAAALFGLAPMPPELVYHVALLVFWALSAPCMFFLLRTLGCGLAAASFGSLAFCILPWRTSYAPEFQMELAFALPLFFAFLARFLRDRRAADAALCALSWWLLAVSELYEAVFAAMAAPVVAAAFFAREPRMLRERRFWRGALAGAAAGAASLFVLLQPYLTQRGAGAVLRPLKETAVHGAQPFSYLLPWGDLAPWKPNARPAELSLYPTLAVLLLCLGAAAWRTAALRRGRARAALCAHAAAAGAAVLFALVCLAFHAGALDPARAEDRAVWRVAARALAFASAALALVAARGESPRGAFLRGMGAVAGLAFLLSLGPVMSLGEDFRLVARAFNPVSFFCHRVFPFLSGFRVAARFGVLVLFAALCAASVFLDRLLAAVPPRRRAWAAPALVVPLLACVAAEAVPPRAVRTAFRPVDPQRASPAIERLAAERPARTVAALPMGPRDAEGARMFSLLKGDWFSVYAWGGFFPPWSVRVQELASRFDAEGLRHELAKLFPEALVVADAAEPVRIDRPAAPLPPGAVLRETEPGRVALVDWETILAPVAALRDRDGRFLLFDLKPEPPAPEVEKLFRSDVARMNPVVRAVVEAAPGTAVSVSLNGRAVPLSMRSPSGGGPLAGADRTASAFAMPDGGAKDLSFAFGPDALRALEKAAPDSLVFRSEDGTPISVRSFRLEGRDGVYHDPCAPHGAARATPPRTP